MQQGSQWFVAHTRPNCEQHAQKFLQSSAWGATVYVPLVLTRVAHAGRVEFLPKPFLPRYIFVRANGAVGARRVGTAPGVSSLIAGTDGTALVTDAVLDEIRGREDANGFVQMDPGVDMRVWPPAAGEEIRVTRGKLAGSSGLFGMEKGEDRSMVFVRLLGRLSRVTVPNAWLSRT